jgi:glutamine---fructose-6-phosphate transaminase (isomerizing)
MRGIFGYANYGADVPRHKILATFVNDLKSLEYDSAGLAVDGAYVRAQMVVRAVGAVDALKVAVEDAEVATGELAGNPILSSHVGIPHTHCATHGALSGERAPVHVGRRGPVSCVSQWSHRELQADQRDAHRLQREVRVGYGHGGSAKFARFI